MKSPAPRPMAAAKGPSMPKPKKAAKKVPQRDGLGKEADKLNKRFGG